ncbi:MAG: protein kinase [Propionivibrio sp.]|uniref:Protein kinase n=1 Tax=Candidatus Propionivibrio dominans TaxID=2954373 RepID=A0A9D7F9S1_9RHOO|nr:protein kinase [Candidatus Propionivibrio dominans]
MKAIMTLSPFIGNLIGQALPDGWVIDRQLPRPGTAGATDLSGSFFSVGFIAKKTVGKKQTEAFLKVIDVGNALQAQPGHSSLMERLKNVTDSYSFECSVLDICEKARLDRVVQVIAKGELPPPPGSAFPIPIPYMLFELADGDVRKIVSRTNKIDDAWRLRVLHNVAVGLQQLHGVTIAHQDLKPSNVLLFETSGQGAKIGDLGRASRLGMEAQHDALAIAGALSYAPPEQAFGIRPELWVDRREGCDLYHLGTLATFLFAGITPTDFYLENLPIDVRPAVWNGQSNCDYQTALPVLMSTFTAFVDAVSSEIPEWARGEMSQIILNACNPDYKKRGDPGARAQIGEPIGIQTFVARFARLSKRAEIEVRR